MDNLCQVAAWDYYPGVCDQGYCYLKEIQFLLNNLSLLWPIDTKLGVWDSYNKRQLGIATQVSMVKVIVT
jgi:hypothetical protein